MLAGGAAATGVATAAALGGASVALAEATALARRAAMRGITNSAPPMTAARPTTEMTATMAVVGLPACPLPLAAPAVTPSPRSSLPVELIGPRFGPEIGAPVEAGIGLEGVAIGMAGVGPVPSRDDIATVIPGALACS
jgi:hypothetical protein